jgi:hypothetical protein
MLFFSVKGQKAKIQMCELQIYFYQVDAEAMFAFPYMFHTKFYAPSYCVMKGRKINGNINQLKLTQRRILNVKIASKASFMNKINVHLNKLIS